MIPDRVFVTGTDTDVGKTVVCAALCAAFGHAYWKPVQAGLTPLTDTETVSRLTGALTHPEAYRLTQASSPHSAAEAEGVRIELSGLTLPQAPRLIVEGAGGWRVPYAVEPTLWTSDLVHHLGLPVLVVARAGLGTLNHTLLTLDAIRRDGHVVAGLVLVGEPHPRNAQDLAKLGHVRVLSTLPRVADLAADFRSLVVQLQADAVQAPQPPGSL